MSLLSFNHVSKFFGGEQVLGDVTFHIEPGDHVALVGVNGAGKSTILRIAAGIEAPDGGDVTRERGLRIAYLEQEPNFDPNSTLFQTVLDAFAETIAAQQRLQELGKRLEQESNSALLEEYSRLQAQVEHTGYDYRRQVEQALTGLGLEPELWDSPVGVLSGGQRTRANLARTLLLDADLLLLDEPTNHLDIPAVEWLESYLRGLKRAFLLVAHDRYLLDRVTTHTVELSHGRTSSYNAPYSRYLELRAERRKRQAVEYEAQQEHIARTEEFIRHYGAGQRAKEARGRQKRLDRLERVERPQEEEQVHLALGKARRAGDLVLEVHNLVVGYPAAPLVRLPEEIAVPRGERVAIIGPNGSGKTTLLRTLIGSLDPLGGRIRWGANTDVGYYSQSLEGLDENRTVLEEIQEAKPLSEEEARTLLAQFLFTGDDVFKRVGALSGGEKSRVALARLIVQQPNVLVLDEPTNHLDIASRDALQAVFSTFPGTLIFVSHDRFLIDALAGQVWQVQDGRLRRYAGTYSAVAGGSAVPLDRPERPHPVKRNTAPPHERLPELQRELTDLSTRLADAGRTAPLPQIAALLTQVAALQAEMEESQEAWLRSMRSELRTSSV